MHRGLAYLLEGSGEMDGGLIRILDPEPPEAPALLGTANIQGGALGLTMLQRSWTARQWAMEASASSEYSRTDWSARQATGPPDTGACDDLPTAWAPATDGEAPEHLELRFGRAAPTTGIRIRETYNTGSVFLVELIDPEGITHPVWEGVDTTPCPGVLAIDWPATSYDVAAVRIHTRIAGWEEIDAVELIYAEREGTVAAVASDETDLTLVDVSDPVGSALLSRAWLSGWSAGIDTDGRWLYLANDFAGLRVVDSDDPLAPVEVASLPSLFGARAVAVSGSLAYVAWYDGISVLDLSRPDDPLLLGHLTPDHDVIGLATRGETLFGAAGQAGLLEIDTTDPARPYVVGQYVTPDAARDALPSGDRCFVADGDLQVVRLNPRLSEPEATAAGVLRVVVPSGFTPGPYHVLVTHRDGTTERLPNGFRICRGRALEARLEPVIDPAGPAQVMPVPWRLRVEGDDLFFSPEPRHQARLLLPPLPADPIVEPVPGGPGERAIKLDLLPAADEARVRLIGDDPAALERLWNQARAEGGFPLLRRDAHTYGDLTLAVAVRDVLDAAWQPADVPVGPLPTSTGALRIRYEFTGDVLTAARAEGREADLIVETTADDGEQCVYRTTASFLETRDDLCEQASGLLPHLALNCGD
jgi:hypothetical protein